MDVSVLIVNWNTRDYLAKCLHSLRNAATGISYEVIVVDNASSDQSPAMVARDFPEVHLIASKENIGFARANNLAFSKSSGDYVLVMNPDCYLPEGALDGLLAFAKTHPDAGVISPRLLNPDGSIQEYYGRIPTFYGLFPVHRGWQMDRQAHAR